MNHCNGRIMLNDEKYPKHCGTRSSKKPTKTKQCQLYQRLHSCWNRTGSTSVTSTTSSFRLLLLLLLLLLATSRFGLALEEQPIDVAKDVVDVCTARSISRTRQIKITCCKMFLNCRCITVMCAQKLPANKKCNDLVKQCKFIVTDSSHCQIDESNFKQKCPRVNINLTVFEPDSNDLRNALTGLVVDDKVSYILYAVAGALLLLAIIIGVYCYCRQKSHKNDRAGNKSSEKLNGSIKPYSRSNMDNRTSSSNINTKKSSQRTMVTRSKNRSTTSYNNRGQRTSTTTTSNNNAFSNHTHTILRYNDITGSNRTTTTSTAKRNKSKSQNLIAANKSAIKSFNSRACMTQHGFTNPQVESRNVSNNKINYTALRKALA